jgi:HD-GYP domain-containing protein (c-di-GMP phosphodiesterase class II)/CHASE2 domain-containing sensor protein
MRSPRSTTNRRLVFLSGAIPVLVAAVLTVYRPSPVVRLDTSTYDTLVRSVRTKPPGGRVVIVDVDERSLSAIGQWPWRRDVIGQLLARLHQSGPSIVALDIIFAEPDRYGMDAAPSTATDDLFAKTLHEGRVVLGYAATFDAQSGARRPCVLHPVALAIVGSDDHAGASPFFHATDAVCSLPALGQAAGASGFLNAVPDADGILRRVPLLVELDDRVYPSLALAAVSAATGVRQMTLQLLNVNASALTIDNQVVLLDGRSNALLRYRGKKNTFSYVSAADVMSGALPAGALRDKIVFVGMTALGTREVVATPLDTRFAGVEVQATVADNLLQHDFISRSQFATSLEGLATLALGIAIAALVANAGLLTGALAGAGGIAAFWGMAVWRLSTSGAYVSPLAPTVAVGASLVLMTLTKFVLERQRADRSDHETTNAQRLMVQTLLSLTETRDAETGRHSRRTQRYAKLLAGELSKHPNYREFLTPERVELLSSLAPLHDIGKVGVPDHILNKPGALTPDELVEMRKHPVLGWEVIVKAEQQAGIRDDVTLAMAKDIVYTHHERWDGAGYPQGLRGTEIPIPGRVMAVVDVYDAITTRTLYRATMSHDASVKLIIAGTGTHFDPAVVEAFVGVAPVLQAVLQETERADRELSAIR